MADPKPLLDVRMEAFKAADVILATLQATFAQDQLMGGRNPYRFIKDQPGLSKVWVCDPESRIDTQGGNRMMVTVTRGDYQPQELHLMNRMEMTSDGGARDFSDLATTPIIVSCEGGNKIQSETLASIVYSILKFFRLQLMAEYDLHSLKMLGISSAVHYDTMPGKPWLTTVSLRVETQEHIRATEIAENLNMVAISAMYTQNLRLPIATLDGLGAAAAAEALVVPATPPPVHII